MYPEAYLEFLAHFHGDRDYFECHEILEEYWKEIDPRNKESIWVGLILVAVSNYHYRRLNFKGAKRTIEKAISILQAETDSISELGLDQKLLLSLLRGRLEDIAAEIPYNSFQLPIIDPILTKLGKQKALQKGFIWGKDSDKSNVNLIHRHKLRDRTEVIKERENSLKKRKDNE